MGRTLTVFGLAAVLTVLAVDAAQAQRFGGGRRGGGGSSFGISTPFGSYYQGSGGYRGYGSGYGYGSPYGGYGYGSGYGSGYGWGNPGYASGYGLGMGHGYYGGGYGYGSGYGYPGSYGSGMYTGGSFSQPYYGGEMYSSGYAAMPAYQQGTPGYQSFYQGPQGDPNSVTLRVRVPDANAELWVQGQQTQQRGTERVFTSPPLTPGSEYTYSVKAKWMENGQPQERTLPVTVRPGQTIPVDFTQAGGTPLGTGAGDRQPVTPPKKGPDID